MSEKLNATCTVCGQRYHLCSTCRSVKTIKPWRTIADTIECYKIYMVIHDYENKAVSREEARQMLDRCTIPSELQTHIKAVIDEIKNT